MGIVDIYMRKNSILFSYQFKAKNLHRSFYTKPAIQSDEGNYKKEKHPRITKAVYQFRALIEDLFYMSEFKQSQLKVMAIKDELQIYSFRKRNILFDIDKIRKDFLKCRQELHNTPRESIKYKDLVKKEDALLKLESDTISELSNIESLQKQSFTNLAYAVNESYEKEKLHSHSLKMWGLIGTLIGTGLSFITSAIARYYHNKLTKKEGWGSYPKRHGSSAYRYFYPKSK